MLNRTRIRFRPLLLVTMAVLVAAPLGAWAHHQFSDVPSGNPFHGEISAIADAGITTGYSDGTYRPGANVSRQAMAAFMERGFGRAATGRGAVPIPPDGVEVIASLTIDAGGADSGTGFVVVQGSWTGYTNDPSGCPCDVGAFLHSPATSTLPATDSIRTWDDLGTAVTEAGYVSAGGSVSLVLPIGADETRDVVMVGFVDDSNASGVAIEGEITATYVPFGPDGDDTLIYGDSAVSSSSADDDVRSSAIEAARRARQRDQR